MTGDRRVPRGLATWLAGLLLAAAPVWPAADTGKKPLEEDVEPHAAAEAQEAHHSSRITDERLPLQLDGFPERPSYLIELGNPYLGTGRIGPGFTLPTGASKAPR